MDLFGDDLEIFDMDSDFDHMLYDGEEKKKMKEKKEERLQQQQRDSRGGAMSDVLLYDLEAIGALDGQGALPVYLPSSTSSFPSSSSYSSSSRPSASVILTTATATSQTSSRIPAHTALEHSYPPTQRLQSLVVPPPSAAAADAAAAAAATTTAAPVPAMAPCNMPALQALPMSLQPASAFVSSASLLADGMKQQKQRQLQQQQQQQHQQQQQQQQQRQHLSPSQASPPQQQRGGSGLTRTNSSSSNGTKRQLPPLLRGDPGVIMELFKDGVRFGLGGSQQQQQKQQQPLLVKKKGAEWLGPLQPYSATVREMLRRIDHLVLLPLEVLALLPSPPRMKEGGQVSMECRDYRPLLLQERVHPSSISPPPPS